MNKHSTAPSVRTKRTRSKLGYETLENRNLLAADLLPMAATQVCEAPQKVIAEKSKNVANTVDAFFKSKQFAEVTDVIVGDGTSNRSIVESITIEFDNEVKPQTGAFVLIQRESRQEVDLVWTVDNSSATPTVTLTFTGELTGNGGSLKDGNYQLTVIGELLGGSNPDSEFVFGDNEEDNLYRYFSDTSGDRHVDIHEILQFRKTWLSTSGEASFDSRFDDNADGVVNVYDLLQFRKNYHQTLEWV